MLKKWRTLKRIKGPNFRIFSVDTVIRESSNSGKSKDFFLVEAPNWMTVIPLVKNEYGQECFLMVKQYRHGSDSITLEFPAGMVDPGEDVFYTAKRELKEETGYICQSLELIGSINPNPAFMTNTTSTFLAKGLSKVSEQNLDEYEEIETLLVPINQFQGMIGGQEVNSAIMIQAYYFYLQTIHDTSENK